MPNTQQFFNNVPFGTTKAVSFVFSWIVIVVLLIQLLWLAQFVNSLPIKSIQINSRHRMLIRPFLRKSMQTNRIDSESELDQSFDNDNPFKNHLLTYGPISTPDQNHCTRIPMDFDPYHEDPDSETKTESNGAKPKEIFLPINIDELIPKSSSKIPDRFQWNSTTKVNELENNDGWIKFNNNNNNMVDVDEDFLNHLIQSKQDAERRVTNRVTTTTTTTSTTTEKPSLRKKISTKLQLPPVPQEAERRLLMSGPFRRLLMAYYAPRILRLQFSMLLNTLIGEVTRKLFDPLINGMGGSSRQAPTSVPTPSPSSTSSSNLLSDPASLNQLLTLLQGSNLGNLNLGNQFPQQQQQRSIVTPAPPLASQMLSQVPVTPKPVSPQPTTTESPTVNPINSMMNLDFSNLNLNDPEMKMILNTLGGTDLNNPQLLKQLLDVGSSMMGGGGSSPSPSSTSQSSNPSIDTKS